MRVLNQFFVFPPFSLRETESFRFFFHFRVAGDVVCDVISGHLDHLCHTHLVGEVKCVEKNISAPGGLPYIPTRQLQVLPCPSLPLNNNARVRQLVVPYEQRLRVPQAAQGMTRYGSTCCVHCVALPVLLCVATALWWV